MHGATPALVGFNNNVRYRGLRFHIQTEDSGVTRPHIITHLFADGGRVIKSVRTDYSEYVDHPDRPALIQRMMRDQHRAMAIDLRDGRFDVTIDSLRSQPPEPAEDLRDPKKTLRFPEPHTLPRVKARGSMPPPLALTDQRQAEAPHDAAPDPRAPEAAACPTQPEASQPPNEPCRSRPPPRNHRPSRAPEGVIKRRSGAPKARRSLGRPSAVLEAKPSAESIFGAKPQESLDDVILSYVTQAKPPDSRGRK